jgi:iron(III) transport system permease protein
VTLAVVAGTRPSRRAAEPALIAIVIAGVVLLIGLPMLFVLLSAILADPFTLGSGFTLASLGSVYTSPTLLWSLWQTVAMAVGIGVVATVIGGILAWMTVRVAVPARGMLGLIAVLPLFMSPLVAVIAWISIGAPHSGLVNAWLMASGAPDWLRLNIMSLPGIIFVMTVHYVPYGYLFLAGALRNMDASLEEASYVAGESVIGTAIRIAVPLMRAPFLSSMLFVSILAAGEFSVPSLLGGRSGFVPLSVRVYEAINGFPQDYGRASAIGTMLIAISVGAFYLYRRSLRNAGRFVTMTGKNFAIRQVDPGRWAWLILAVFALYALVTVVLPYCALIFVALSKFRTGALTGAHLTLSHVATVLGTPDVRLAARNSVIVSLVVPAICVLLALLLAYAHDRQRMPGSGIAMYIASIPIAVSGIVFASGILVVYITTPLYGTIWLIALGLVAHYLTHAIRITSNGLGQIDPSLEEAARVNGAGLVQTLRSIVAPLLAPSIGSAALLIFIFCIREVNTAIMLYSPDSQLLAVLSWNYAADGDLSSAAVVGLLQTVIMVVVILLARLLLGVSAAKDVA